MFWSSGDVSRIGRSGIFGDRCYGYEEIDQWPIDPRGESFGDGPFFGTYFYVLQSPSEYDQDFVLGSQWFLSLAEAFGERTFFLAGDNGGGEGDSGSSVEVASGRFGSESDKGSSGA